MATRHRRARVVPLTDLLRQRHPEIEDPRGLIASGAVLVGGSPILNPAAHVRSDATVRIAQPKRLRGDVKLSAAIASLGLEVSGRVALDIGAAAGGFSAALPRAGATRVYAVDAGHGQLRGWLRCDPRVVNLERTNLGRLEPSLVPDEIEIVTMDLSYLSVAEAVPQLDRLRLADRADLLALVKPTFELGQATVARRADQVDAAVRRATRSLQRCGWSVLGQARSPIAGRRGAVEIFLRALRSKRSL